MHKPPYNPSLDGLRAVASMGVLLTHTSFQTGHRLLERFDLFVAVFFVLSAFVLSRGGFGPYGEYAIKRVRRIMPAYVACVLVAFAIYPQPWSVVVSTLTLTQIYVGLAPGITHLWSLCVEVAWYVVLPFTSRVPSWLLIALACVSLGWDWVPFGPNPQIMPPAFTSWFVAGIILARLEASPPRWLVTVARRRWPLLGVAAAALVAATIVGPHGLVHPSHTQFVARIMLGTVFGWCVVAPFALAPGGLLASTPIRWVGLRSYSLFLWHLPVLALVFPVLGIAPFTGHFFVVTIATIMLSLWVSDISYRLVEQPFSRGAFPTVPRFFPN